MFNRFHGSHVLTGVAQFVIYLRTGCIPGLHAVGDKNLPCPFYDSDDVSTSLSIKEM
jgi:hypothetical protein